MSGTTSRKFEAVIVVDDRTAAAIARISTRLRAIAGMSGLQGIVASARGAQRSFGAMLGRIGMLNAGLARLSAWTGLGGAAVAAGMFAIVQRSAEAAGELDDLNDRFGVATQQMQAFRYAAVAGGQSGEVFTRAMVGLNRNMGEAAAGRNQNVVALFRRLGINLRDSHGHIRATADVLPQLAQAIMRNENPVVRQRIALTAMGEAGAALIPTFANGAEGLRRFTDEWNRYGYTFTDQDRENAKGYSDAMRRLSTALRGTADAIGTQLHPVLTPLVQQFTEWVRANRELIAIKVEEWVRAVADFIKNIDFAKLREDFAWFLGEAQRIYEAIGGWKTIAIATAAYLTGPFVASIAVLVAAITTTLIPSLGQAGRLMAGLASQRLAAGAIQMVPVAGAAAAPAAAAGVGAAAPTVAAGAAGAGTWLTRLLGAGRAAGALVGGAANLAGVAAAAGMILGSAEDPAIRRQSRARLNAGANGARFIEGFNAPDAEEAAAAPRSSWLSRIPSLFGRGDAAASAAQPVRGQVDVNIRLENAPPGTRIAAETRGDGVMQPELDVGHATLGAH